MARSAVIIARRDMEVLAVAKEPIVHDRIWLISSCVARESMSVVAAEAMKLTIMPQMSITVVSEPTARRTSSTTTIERRPPRAAPNVTAALPSVATMPHVKTMATPTTAPPDIPMVYGSTRGLRKRPCIIAPEMERSAPTPMAHSMRGRRNSWTISSRVAASASARPSWM